MALIYRHHFPCTVTAENPHGKGYVGYTYSTVEERDRKRFAQSAVKDSVGLKRAIVKYSKENMQTDTIQSGIMHHEVLKIRERYWIRYFDDFRNGYNRTKGGDGFDPETAREISCESNRKRVETGTHHFLGGEAVRKSVEDGTHNLLGGDIQRENALKRVENGTNPFLGGDIQREIVRKRIENRTHNILRENNPTARPEYYQVYWEFILLYPLGIKEVRKHLSEKFGDIPRWTRNRWIKKWQAELEEPTTEKS